MLLLEALLFLPNLYVFISFSTSCLFVPIKPPVKCEIGLLRADIFTFFLLFRGKHPLFSPLSMMLTVLFL